MEQRQPRLGDILDDYCPRERRVTNHAVVAMVGTDVKQTRCSTCDAEHEFKHAKVPRQRRKAETPAALYAQVAAGAPKRVAHDQEESRPDTPMPESARIAESPAPIQAAPEATSAPPARDSSSTEAAAADSTFADEDVGGDQAREEEDGPVHRPLIRASLPRTEGQPPPTRPLPEFTIRQPGGRQNRFRPRNPRGGGQVFQGNRSNGNMGGGPMRSGMPRQGGGRPPQGGTPSRLAHHHGPGRKRSK